MERLGELDEVRRSSPRTMAGAVWSTGGVNGVSKASTRCVAACGRRGSLQEGSSTAYGRQVAGHAAVGEFCPN